MFQDTQKMIVRVLPPKPSLLNETVASLGFTQRPVSVDVGTDREDFPPLSPNFSPATICKFTLRSAFGCMKLQGSRVEGDGSNPLKNGLSGGEDGTLRQLSAKSCFLACLSGREHFSDTF